MMTQYHITFNFNLFDIVTDRKQSVCNSVNRGGGGAWGVCFQACITGHMTRGICIKGACIQGDLHLGGLYQGIVCIQRGLSRTTLPPKYKWNTMGYGQQAGGTHPNRILSCLKQSNVLKST